MIGTAKRRCRDYPASQPMSATLTSREGMSDFLAISRPAPILDAKKYPSVGGKAQAKASATSIPQLGGFFCPLQCYGHPSVGEKARAKAGATSTSQFGCPCSYYRCPSVEREARAKAGATTTSTIGRLLFFAVLAIPKCGREGTG